MATQVDYVKFSASGATVNYSALMPSDQALEYVAVPSSAQRLYYFDRVSIKGRVGLVGVVRYATDPAPTAGSLVGTETFTEGIFNGSGWTYRSAAGSATSVSGYRYNHSIVYDDETVAAQTSSLIVDNTVVEGANLRMSFNDDAYYVYALPSGSPYVSGRIVSIPADTASDVEVIVTRTPKFTVKFNANGGSGSMSDQSFVYGVSQRLRANTFVAPSALDVFNGWNTSDDGSGTAYADGEDVSNLTQTPGGIVTLYAQWRFVGFDVTVTNSADVGTLTLVRVSDNATLATESGGALTYKGVAGVAYKVVCTMSDGYVAPAGISGLDDDTFTPLEGEIVSCSYATSFYAVVLPSEDEHGNSLAVTSPSSPDTTISVSGVDKPAYAKGRNVVVTATCADEWSLTAAYLDDLQGYNQASYTGDAVAGGAFTIRSIQQSYAVRATFGEKHYTVSAATDEPSESALTVYASASYVVKDASVTFTATAATGYAFEGWYLDGEKVSSSAEYTRTIDADTALVAKAKVSVSLDITSNDVSLEDYASLEVDGEAYTPATEFYVILGDSFSYVLTVTAANKYFNGWFVKPYVPETSVPLAGYGDTKTVTPTMALNIVALIGDIDPTAPVQASFAYANGSDSTMGTFSVGGVVGPQTVELEYDEQVAPSVTLAAQPKNGYVFAGWFASASAQGDPITVGQDGVLSIAYSRTIYARFDKNTHSICEWEGSTVPKSLTWRTKTYEASKPFNPSSCRVDALGYAGDERNTLLELTVDMYSAPDVNARATATTTLANIANQNARRLPVRRMERYMQIEVKANAEVDALFVGTSMGGLAQ